MVAAARSPQVTLYRRDVVDLAAAALFVVATIMLAWLSARRAAWLWIVGGAASAAALAAPAPTFLIGTALFLSVLAAAVLRLATLLPIEPPVRQSRELTLSTVSFPNPLLLIAGLMLAASFLPLGPAHGQLAPFQPVLIPVDDQGRVSLRDKYVYLPESLYRGLRQSALRLDTAPRSWLLRSTDYEAVFGWGEGASSIECQRIAVELEFEVVAAPTTIKLPLAWRNIGLAQNSVRLDGAPIHLKWWDQEKSFSFAVNTAGVVRLSLEIEPRVVGDGSENRIEIPILPVADSTLKVRYPGRVERVEAPEVLGNFARDARTGEFSAEMGPADRLTIIWPESEERSVPARSQHVEQYAWLHIQPDAVVLDAKWKFLAGGPIEEVHVLADDNLTPLPSTAPGLAGFTQVRRDGRQSLRLQLDQPRTPPFDFQISFLVEGAVGVGRPAAPAIDLQNATPAQRRLAITYDPALKSENVATDGLEPLAVTQFRSEWGASSPAPQSAYRLLGDNFAWSAQTRLPDIPLGGEAQCDLVFRREEVRALYRANLELGKGHRLLLRAAAKGLRIQRVAVLEGGLNRVEHWSQSESGEVLAFLNGRVAGACQVEIDGQASIPLRGEIDLPQIELADSGAPATGYRIYGAPEVSLQITNLKGFTREEAEPLERYVADRGRLEGILQGDGSSEAAPAARIEMQPNRPRVVRKQLVTTLRPGASQWSFDLELQFQANQGVVDVVRFDLPQEVAEPLDVQPPARWELRDVGRPGRQLLVVRPESPLTGRTTLRVTGLLRQPPGEAVRAPAIEPLDFGEMPQFLVLPRRWRSQPLTCEVSGMRAEVIPGAAPEDLSVPATSYRVVNKPRHGAVLRRTENVVGDPRVRLMDVEMLLQSPSDYYATAVFALDPAGMNQCIFALPDEARLVHADMDGRAVSPTPLNGRRYAFDFERTRLNIRLSISYAGRIAPDDAGQFILPAPLLLDIPVDQSLWTVSSVAPNVTVRLASEVSRNRQNQLRLAALEEILQAPAATESAYTKPALAQLRGSWARRWIEALLGDAASTINAETALDTLDEDQRALVEQYELEPVLLEVIQAARQNKGLTDFAHQANSSRAALEGPGPVAMFVAADSSSLSAQYTVSAAVVFLIACLLAAGFRRVHEAEWLARFAPLLLVAAGLVWWTWLTPSGAGLLAVAAGLWLSLSRPARHSLPTPRSSIVNLPVRY